MPMSCNSPRRTAAWSKLWLVAAMLLLVTCDDGAEQMAESQEVAATAPSSITPKSKAITWKRTLIRTQEKISAGVIQIAKDGGYVVSFSEKLMKLSARGKQIWERKSIGGIASIQLTNDGNYALAVNLQEGTWLVKRNPEGAELWKHKISGGWKKRDGVRALLVTKDDDYVVAGVRISDVRGSITRKAFVVKLDSTGERIWSQTFRDINIIDARDIKAASDGGYIIAGIGGKNTGIGEGVVVKLNKSGEIEWSASFDGSALHGDISVYFNAIQVTKGGGYVVVSDDYSIVSLPTSTSDGEASFKESWVLRLDANGKQLWERKIDNKYSDCPARIQVTPDHGYVVSSCQLLVKLSQKGSTVWKREIDGMVTSMTVTKDGGYVLTGENSSVEWYEEGLTNRKRTWYETWALKLNKDGLLAD